MKCCICSKPATHKHGGGRGGGYPSYVCLKHIGKTSKPITIKESLDMAKFYRVNSISITGGPNYRYVLNTNRVERVDLGSRKDMHGILSVELPEDLGAFFKERELELTPFHQYLVMYKGWHQAQVANCLKQPDKLKLELKCELFVMYLDFTSWVHPTFTSEFIGPAELYERWYGTHEVVEDSKQQGLEFG